MPGIYHYYMSGDGFTSTCSLFSETPTGLLSTQNANMYGVKLLLHNSYQSITAEILCLNNDKSSIIRDKLY